MKIITEQQGNFGANCYMVSTDRAAVIIDPSVLTPKLEEFINESEGKQSIILATHRHFDHVAAVAEVKRLTGADIAVHTLDECGLLSSADSLGANFGISHTPVKADLLLEDEQVLSVGDLSIRVLHTPGHTAGSCCFVVENVIFSGDTLFRQSVGRTDFPTGDPNALMSSLTRLFALDGDYTVYPGHEQPTVLCYEKNYNPYYDRNQTR